jgi:hypothetical protein
MDQNVCLATCLNIGILILQGAKHVQVDFIMMSNIKNVEAVTQDLYLILINIHVYGTAQELTQALVLALQKLLVLALALALALVRVLVQPLQLSTLQQLNHHHLILNVEQLISMHHSGMAQVVLVAICLNIGIMIHFVVNHAQPVKITMLVLKNVRFASLVLILIFVFIDACDYSMNSCILIVF